MTSTENLTATALIAARVNRGDLLGCWDGEIRTVDDYATSEGSITWTFTDGTQQTTGFLRTVTIYI